MISSSPIFRLANVAVHVATRLWPMPKVEPDSETPESCRLTPARSAAARDRNELDAPVSNKTRIFFPFR